MESLRDIYKRFKTNYRTDTGGINIYPQFDYDLEWLMRYLEDDYGLMDVDVDCSWRPPEGGNEW